MCFVLLTCGWKSAPSKQCNVKIILLDSYCALLFKFARMFHVELYGEFLGDGLQKSGCFKGHFSRLLQAIYITAMIWYWWWHWQPVWCDFFSSFKLQLLPRMERVLNLSDTKNCTHLVWHAVTGAEVILHLVTYEDCITFIDQSLSAKCKERCVRCGVLCWQDTVFVSGFFQFW